MKRVCAIFAAFLVGIGFQVATPSVAGAEVAPVSPIQSAQQDAGPQTTYGADGSVTIIDDNFVYGWRPLDETESRTLSALGCNRDVCIDVVGEGLFVHEWKTQAFGNVGCTDARFVADGAVQLVVGQVCPYSTDDGVYFARWRYGGNFFNGTDLCNGWDRIPGYPCIIVHS